MSSIRQQIKSSSSHSVLQSKTLSSFHDRKRILSLKSVIKKPRVLADTGESHVVLARLQEALEKDNRKASRLISQPEATIPGFQQLDIDHKLWKYFQNRMQSVKTKVEKQQVNFCEREFEAIKKLIERKRDGHRYHLEATQKIIKDKYRQIHQLFEEIKQEKISKFVNTVKKNSLKIMQKDNTQKLVLIKQSIENIRSQLSTLETQYKYELLQEEKLTKEWKSLLTNFTKHGYFMNDGVVPIFKEMIKLDYIPAKEDFPGFIDGTTFNCFLKRYYSLKRQQLNARQEKEKEREKSKVRHVSASMKQIRQIAKQPRLNRIYQETREYMVDWLRNESWKESCLLPKINERQPLPREDWQAQERRRMKLVYEDEASLRTIKSMLFGPKVEILPL